MADYERKLFDLATGKIPAADQRKAVDSIADDIIREYGHGGHGQLRDKPREFAAELLGRIMRGIIKEGQAATLDKKMNFVTSARTADEIKRAARELRITASEYIREAIETRLEAEGRKTS